MTKICSSCDVTAPHDARYCRHCGAPLARSGDTSANVSPIANTVPLYGQNPTDEIVPNSPERSAAHTSEVTHEEMYDVWRRSTAAGQVRDDESARPGNGQSASARRERAEHNSSSAHQAESFQAASPHDTARADYDPEQTQITISVRPLTSRNLPADAAAASVARRANSSTHFDGTPQQVTLSPTGSLLPASHTPAAPALPSPAQPNEARAFRVWLGMGAAILSVVVICGVAVALWFGTRGDGRAPETPPPAGVGGEVAAGTNDPKQLLAAKLAEADTLIASGNASEAVARLREAAVLDPADPEPHRRLARLLLANGSRREAIEELRVVTRLVPAEAEAWRSLASAQFAEGLYEDALESYRALGEASPAALARDSVQLAYADALRLAGRTADARVIYRRLATSSDAQVAAASKRQLAQPAPSPTSEEAADAGDEVQTADASRTAGATTTRDDANRPPDAPAAAPTAQPTVAAPPRASSGSPSEQYQRGVALWTANRAAAITEFRSAAARGNSDAHYYLGLSIAEGRDPRSLKRADLVAAIVHFGRARHGKFRGQSVNYEEQLGRELDRRRNQPSQ